MGSLVATLRLPSDTDCPVAPLPEHEGVQAAESVGGGGTIKTTGTEVRLLKVSRRATEPL